MGQNQTQVLKSSGAVTATANSSDFFNREGRGLVLAITTTASSGTSPTLTVKVQGKAASGAYYDIPGAATAAISTNTTTVLTVYPGIATSANAAVSQVVPRIYRLVWTIGGSGSPSVTFSVDGMTVV